MRFMFKTDYEDDIRLFPHSGYMVTYGVLLAFLVVAPFVLSSYLVSQLVFVFIYATVGVGLMILTGLTMSPQMDSGWSFLIDIFGGRQSARSIHFIVTWMLVGFFIVHIAMVVLAGPFNEVRSMITGRYRLPKDKGPRP